VVSLFSRDISEESMLFTLLIKEELSGGRCFVKCGEFDMMDNFNLQVRTEKRKERKKFRWFLYQW
jgi:hypothetical protein